MNTDTVVDIVDLSKRTESKLRPRRIGVEWTDLNMTLRGTGKNKKTEWKVLNNLSGSVQPGEMCALMGPSGCGKTTLLQVLAGRQQEHTEGTVLYNGKKQNNSLKRSIGYVPQEDVMLASLTVRENLTYSALLRLPQRLPRKAKLERVEETIVALGLGGCADSQIGDEIIRGISGGERRRTAIGIELLTNPSVLFLDEPTSGLDAFSSYKLMNMVKRLASDGRTIIASIHQPRQDVFFLFDKLLLMSAGEPVFYGPTDHVIPFFADNAYPLPRDTNPADFIIDVITEENSARLEKQRKGGQGVGCPSIEALVAANRTRITGGESDPAGRPVTRVTTPTPFGELVVTSDIEAANQEPPSRVAVAVSYTKVSPAPAVTEPEDETDRAVRAASRYNNPLYETATLLRRNVWSMLRNPVLTIARVSQNLMTSILVGLLYLRIDTDQSSASDRLGLLFFLSIAAAWTTAVIIVQIFPAERAVFLKEHSGGMYRVSTYFISKVGAELPVTLLWVCVGMTISYWMIGLRASAAAFFIFLAALSLLAAIALGQAIAVSCITGKQDIALVIMPLMLVIQFLFSGFLIIRANIPDYLIWLHYLSMFKYAWEILVLNEMEPLVFTCTASEEVTDSAGVTTCPIQTGPDAYARFGIASDDMDRNFGILVGLMVFYLFLAFAALWRDTRKRHS